MWNWEVKKGIALGGLALVGRQGQLSRYLVGIRMLMARKPLGAMGLVLIVLWIVSGVFAPLVTPGHGPYAQDYTVALQVPSMNHWLGTDQFGRDLYARIIYGSRLSLLIAFTAVGIGGGVGLMSGIASGYLGGWVDSLLMRVVDVLLAFPGLLLILALVAVMGTGVDKIVIGLSVLSTPRTIRIIRGQVLSTKQSLYIEAARAVGASSGRIMLRHILPNVMATFLVLATSLLGGFILTEATLSFLGLGVPPPEPSWGRMLSGGAQAYAQTAPWLVVFPGIAITSMVLGFNLFGDALRDLWDPRLRGIVAD